MIRDFIIFIIGVVWIVNIVFIISRLIPDMSDNKKLIMILIACIIFAIWEYLMITKNDRIKNKIIKKEDGTNN